MPELRLRAGVLTGNAAVEVGAEGEGMVLGDTVNTASRLQSIAAPGTVLVDDVTRRATEAAIAYEDADTHEVKGREQPVHAWTALRVVAGAGGARRSSGLEAPFVGRDAQLQAIIEAGEESTRRGQACHVSVVGEAGSGRSRLLWEFFKYLDGIEEVRWWHQGRCLSYGEGVAYWALAEMVRARARIEEDEDPATARDKLRATVEQFVAEERERRLVEPRLAHLLRLEERPDADRADLFSGWRLFFERLSQEAPVIIAFEDLQWADSGLLDFIDYLLEWSADYPIFVLALARLELRERRPAWDSLVLQPLEPQAIASLLEGLAPGLPTELVSEIVQRAEGIPLYAVETIRMLQDRGLLVQAGARYVVTGDVSELEVPETLHALVASRLDGLSPPERSLLQDASVLGQSFTAAAAAAVSGVPDGDTVAMLNGLVSKQVLARDDDPRSPERGQYVFLQALLRTVAYGTLSRRARKERHIAAARHLEQTWPGEARDIAEVLAAHYLQAIEAEPEADDAETLRSSARETLIGAGRAAASLALGSEADNYLRQATELSSDPLEQAELLEQAGRALWQSGDSEEAVARLRQAIELHQRNGRASGGPAAVTLATAIAPAGSLEEAVGLIEHFLAHEDSAGNRVLRAQALAALGNWFTMLARPDESEAMFKEALTTLEHARAMPALAEAMARQATLFQVQGRHEEAVAMNRHALELADRHDVPAVAVRATFSLAALALEFDRQLEALPVVARGLELTRERGDRLGERMMLSETVQCLSFLGRWEEAMELIPDLVGNGPDAIANFVSVDAVQITKARGEDALATQVLEFASRIRDAADMEFRTTATVVLAFDALDRRDTDAALALVEPLFNSHGLAGEMVTVAYRVGVDAAFAGSDEAAMSRVLGYLDALEALVRDPGAPGPTGPCSGGTGPPARRHRDHPSPRGRGTRVAPGRWGEARRRRGAHRCRPPPWRRRRPGPGPGDLHRARGHALARADRRGARSKRVSVTPTLTCPACGEGTAPGKFCIHCGAPMQQKCPSCGEPILPGAKFCRECGTALNGQAIAPSAMASASGSVSERRLVSVLFADLVGFTALSEHRDPEEVRELLSQYFDRCRSLISRYGGTVEKFIGDAVMAVWGTPVAREDDPERAVRAALSLTQMVSALGEEVGMPELRVRAGVLTGNAAVEVGAEGEGMVLGDTVNTASRLQSVAAPGTVLVDDVTHRASEAAIAYEEAGNHEVKGREQPVHAWTALRVVAGAGGARRSAGLEAPLVARERELELIIEAGERSAHDRHAQHVAILGEAGSGKSRLLWEFFKYLDGIEEIRWWHQGRCLAYGEGVAYWALAEMVRSRARIQEEDPPELARERLKAVVEQFVSDERERRMVEPRLAHLLRLDERPDADRVDLFSGWRLFFERMAVQQPVILAFEDLQWADSGLLDFIDYLLEWSAEFPIFVLTLSRPELRERRPAWQPVSLEALEPQDVATMLDGLAPGLPEELVAQIVRRAEGIPLYAVETIRMLQDRGVLVQEGARYHVTGDVSDLEVPESLHALMASRLDDLSPAHRSLLQDASVLGQSFTAAAAATLSGLPEEDAQMILDSLVARQILARDDDPRSPERGQYVFIQGLLRTVAYGTLPRRARKAKHVAAAQHLEETWPGEARDIAEVVASHYLEAIRAEPDAEDAANLRAFAREKLTAAGQAAASLALGPEADRYFEQAAELAEDNLERAELFEQAGMALRQSADQEAAEQRLRAAISLYERGGRPTGGRAATALAALLRYLGRIEEARGLLENFRTAPIESEDEIVRAEALSELAALLAFSGELREAGPLFEEALTPMEQQEAWPSLGAALVGRAVYLVLASRRQEAVGVLRQALTLAEEHHLPVVALRARINLAQISIERDRFEEALEEVNDGLAMARERGDRHWERQFNGQLMPSLHTLGRWDEAMRVGAPLIAGEPDLDAMAVAGVFASIAVARGDEATLARCADLASQRRDSTYIDLRTAARCALGWDALQRGAAEEALSLVREAMSSGSVASEVREHSFALSIEAATALGDERALRELDDAAAALPRSLTTSLILAGRARLQALRADHRGAAREAETHQDEAIRLLRSVNARPLLAQALLERARRSADGEALAEAREICEELGATRWLERIDQLTEATAA